MQSSRTMLVVAFLSITLVIGLFLAQKQAFGGSPSNVPGLPVVPVDRVESLSIERADAIAAIRPRWRVGCSARYTFDIGFDLAPLESDRSGATGTGEGTASGVRLHGDVTVSVPGVEGDGPVLAFAFSGLALEAKQGGAGRPSSPDRSPERFDQCFESSRSICRSISGRSEDGANRRACW